ncbi:hypothetical protein DL768_001134 [Monosporascus sp. mg162]|nr:hypothetical protein DL768_001134 [Monosporascus sp. mg162]
MSKPSIDNDDFFQDIPPLPASWGWKRCKSVQDAELNALPETQQSLIHPYRAACLARWRDIRGAGDAATYRRFQMDLRRGRLIPSNPRTTSTAEAPPVAAGGGEQHGNHHLTPDELAIVERFGMPREQVGTPLFEIAEVIYRQQCEYWGFMAFRVWVYGSGAGAAGQGQQAEATRWDEFWRRWGKMMNDRLGRLVMDGIWSTGLVLQDGDEGAEARFRDMYEAAMAGGILARWRLVLKEYEAMSGMGPQDVRGVFREMLKLDEEDDESMPNRVPVGVDAGLCLMVDGDVVSSLLDEGRRPYIIRVLSDIDDDEITDEAEAV